MGCLIGMAWISMTWGTAQAQDAGGLVISALPGDVVIDARSLGGAASTVSPAAVQPGSQSAGPVPGGIAGSESTAARRAGLPRPSIIVGDMAILAAIGPRGPLGLPFQLREAIRQRDAALFERLLGRGVFDPDPARMAEAIQTELQRTECYGGAIDGDWGAGSTRAADRWKEAAGSAVETASAQPELFRAIAQGGAMRCAPVAAPAVAANPGRGTTAAATRAATTTTRNQGNSQSRNSSSASRRTTSQPAAGNNTQRGFNPSLLGSGVWR